MSQPRSIFGPLLLIGAGAVWLLIKAGNIPSSNLWALTHVWPYLLIAAGVGLMLHSYWRYITLILDVFIIGGLFFAILNAPQFGWDKPSITGVINFGHDDFYVGPAEPGSGKVDTQIREVSGFNVIEVDYPAQIFISQGSKESVQIEAEDNLLPGLQTQVRGNRLRIFYHADAGERVNPTRIVKITVVVKDLKEVQFDSAGELTLTGLETDDLEVSVNGAGSLELNEIVVQALSVNLSGAGSMHASGTAEAFHLTISGFGSFEGAELHTQTANVSLSGAGSATLWVDEELDATISGAGSVNYYGSPQVTKLISGLGGVNRTGTK